MKMAGTHVESNDILLNITGASIGRSCIFPENIGEANVSQHVSILRLIDKRIVRYLHIHIISSFFQQMIMEKQIGVSREGLSMNRLKDFPIPLPPLEEQKRIVEKIDRLMPLCDSLERELENAAGKQAAILNAVLSRLSLGKNRDRFAFGPRRREVSARKQAPILDAVLARIVEGKRRLHSSY
jgi:type I restriction enzyme, S subunit